MYKNIIGEITGNTDSQNRFLVCLLMKTLFANVFVYSFSANIFKLFLHIHILKLHLYMRCIYN